MTLTRSRTLQYIGILLVFGLLAAGYWYFAVRAGVKTNTGSAQAQGGDDLSNGLAAYWKLDENTGTSTTDGSTNGAAGTLTNGPTWTTGQVGSAVDFDGTDDYITTPDADALELSLERSRFTIAGWFNRDTATTDDTIIAKRNGITAGDGGYIVYIDDATDQLIFEFSDGVDEVSAASTATFTATGWNHFVITQDLSTGSGNPVIYINGVRGAATITGNINDMEPVGNALAQRLGAESDAGNPFDGKLDEIRYYHTRAFSADEVAQLYRLTSPTGVDTSLKGYWSFDGEEMVTYAYDQSGVGSAGTLAGGALPVKGKVGQALNFDGSNDHVNMGSASALDNISNFTTCIWGKSTGAVDGTLISKDDSVTGWNLAGNSTSLASVTFYKGWTGGAGYGEWRTANGTFPNNEWTHVCVTYAAGSTANDPIFYMNGVSVPSTKINTPSGSLVDDSTFSANIGSYGNGAGSFFSGSLDEARIYNRILTAAEVKSLYDRSASDKTNTNISPQGGTSLSAGLALYWPLDEGSGTNADDKAGGSNDGTLTNGPTWTTGQIGSSVDLDGTNDYIALADPASGVLDFTASVDSGEVPGDIWSLSLWFNRDTATTDDTIVAKKNSQTTGTDDGYIVWIDDTTDEINVRVDDVTDADSSEIESSTTYTAAGWHHLMVVFDRALLGGGGGRGLCPMLFVDGVDVTDSGTCLNYLHYSTDLSNALAFTVGAESDGGNPFDGKVDEVRVYNRPITENEIGQLYRLTAPTTGIDTGLRGYWTFDGSDVTQTTIPKAVYDRSGAGNFGSFTNGPVTARGKVGQAINFDGTNDYVAIPAAASINNLSTLTVSGWFNQTSCSSGFCELVGKGYGVATPVNGWRVAADIQGFGRKTIGFLVEFSGTNLLVESSTTYSESQWNHFTVTWDGSTSASNVHMYLNGTEVAYRTQTNATGSYTSDAAQTLDIGSFGGTSEGLNGKIDEVRVYNRILSASEIKSQYDAGNPDKTNTSTSTPQGTGRLDSGLAGYWKLDENTGTSTTDGSTNGNNGTLTNGPTWTTGRIGYGVTLDGTNDYITSATPSLDAPVTLCTWYRISATSNVFDNTADGDTALMLRSASANYEAWSIGIGNDVGSQAHAFAGALDNADGNQSNAFGTTNLWTAGDTWQHICGVFVSSTSRQLYLNGVLDGTNTVSENVQASNLFAGVGTDSTTLKDYGKGIVDEARVYGRALSAEEIANLYRLTTPTGTDTGLKGYWSFNGSDVSGTTAYDQSGAGNTGTLTNGPTLVRGKLGQAINFDGTNDYVTVPDSNAFTSSSISIAVWFKLDSVGVPAPLVNHRTDGNNRIDIFSGGAIYCTFSNGSSSNPGNYASNDQDGNWHYVVCEWDGSTVSTYFDGVLVMTEAYSGTLPNISAPLEIGRRSATSEYLDGSIDEVRIYNRILSASEVKTLYSSGK